MSLDLDQSRLKCSMLRPVCVGLSAPNVFVRTIKVEVLMHNMQSSTETTNCVLGIIGTSTIYSTT
jgi:hypothetical protein